MGFRPQGSKAVPARARGVFLESVRSGLSSTAAAEAREISVSGGPLRGSTVDSAVAAAVLGGGAGVKRDGAGLDQRLRIEELASDRLRRYQRGRVVQE